jgi:hypothetical protein
MSAKINTVLIRISDGIGGRTQEAKTAFCTLGE